MADFHAIVRSCHMNGAARYQGCHSTPQCRPDLRLKQHLALATNRQRQWSYAMSCMEAAVRHKSSISPSQFMKTVLILTGLRFCTPDASKVNNFETFF